jgi:integrase
MSAGHIRRRSPGSWELKFEAGFDPATGKRTTQYRSFKGTKRQAEAALVTLLNQVSNGMLVDHHRETLGEFLTRWNHDWCVTNVSPKTRERWQQLAVLQIIPRLGSMPLQRIKASHLATLYATLSREGSISGGPLAPRTVGHVHRLLRRALGHAVAWGLLATNPAATARPPRLADTEIAIPDEAEIATMLEHLRHYNRTLYALGVLALASGARRGELCALRWQDFDAEAGTMRVERSLETTREGLRTKSPKSKHGRRTISLTASAVEALRGHWRNQQEERLARGLGRATSDDLLFTTPDGAPLKPDTLSRNWLRLTAMVGRPINLHSLRHHHASTLIAAGADILAISRRLGHSSPTITLTVYGHLIAGTDDKAAQAIEALFGRIANAKNEAPRHG